MSTTRTNTRTNTTTHDAADPRHDAPKLTAMGRELLRAIGLNRFSFFDYGIVADSGIWTENLTDEAAGMEKLPKTATGVANVIDKLCADGYLDKTEANEEDGSWVALTELGALVAQQLADEHVNADSDDAPTGGPTGTSVAPVVEGTGELAGGDVQPLAKSTRGRNGTTKLGKTVAKKTGNPKTDAAVNAKTTKSASSKTKKSAAEKPAAKRVPGKFSTKGQHVITNRRSRFSGTIVQLVNVNGIGSTMKPDAAGNTYAKKCVDHDFALYAPTRKEAWDGASDPTQWCPKCKRAAAKKSAAPVEKTSATKKSATKKSATTKTAAAKKSASSTKKTATKSAQSSK